MGIRVRGVLPRGFDLWAGLFSWRGGGKGRSLRRCGVGIGPALRGRNVGTFPGGCTVGTGWWFLRVCAVGMKLLHQGLVGCAQWEEGAAVGDEDEGLSCFPALLLTDR